MVILAVLSYFKETRKADEQLKAKRDQIEGELPRFVATVEQSLKASRDVLAMLEAYKKNAGPAFANELDVLTADMSITPDEKDPTASGKILKSGYGINQTTTARVSTSQSSAVTDAQTAITYFPEFGYHSFWRLLEQTRSGYNADFEFASNKYSTYKHRTHFTPIWMPDGSYTPYTYLEDCWTPAGMLSMRRNRLG